jgi:hypothetical protein
MRSSPQYAPAVHASMLALAERLGKDEGGEGLAPEGQVGGGQVDGTWQ